MDVEHILDQAIKQEELSQCRQELTTVRQIASRIAKLKAHMESTLPQNYKICLIESSTMSSCQDTSLQSQIQKYEKLLHISGIISSKVQFLENKLCQLEEEFNATEINYKTGGLLKPNEISQPQKKQKRCRKQLTQECIVTELKCKSDSNQLLLQLPTEIWIEILNYFTKLDLMVLTTVDKHFYYLGGNHDYWRKICFDKHLYPLEAIHQTFKNKYAVSKLGPKHCQKCGNTTTRKLPLLGIVICRECQPTVALTKTEAKQLYMLKEEDMKNIPSIECGPSGSQLRTLLFLKSDVENFAVSKWKGIDGVQSEILRRKSRKDKIYLTKQKTADLTKQVEDLVQAS